MNSLLCRHNLDPRFVELRRLAIVAGICLAASFCWHSVHGNVVSYFAESSFGNDLRDDLLFAGLQGAGYDSDAVSSFQMRLEGNYGWCVWSKLIDIEGPPSRPEYAARIENTIIDDQFKLRGKYAYGTKVHTWDSYRQTSPVTQGGGGAWLLRVELYVHNPSNRSADKYIGVLRLRQEYNELLWLGLIDEYALTMKKLMVEPAWDDLDGDGIDELVFSTIAYWRKPNAGSYAKPLKALGVFKLREPERIFRTKSLSEESEITPWVPPSDKPLRIEHDELLDEVFRRLLPPPESE